jgi:hypothetical protein
LLQYDDALSVPVRNMLKLIDYLIVLAVLYCRFGRTVFHFDSGMSMPTDYRKL